MNVEERDEAIRQWNEQADEFAAEIQAKADEADAAADLMVERLQDLSRWKIKRGITDTHYACTHDGKDLWVVHLFGNHPAAIFVYVDDKNWDCTKHAGLRGTLARLLEGEFAEGKRPQVDNFAGAADRMLSCVSESAFVVCGMIAIFMIVAFLISLVVG